LLITCDNEAEIARIKAQQMTIREAIADRYQLTTPPNLAFAVGVAYNKPKVNKKPDAGNADSPPDLTSPPVSDSTSSFDSNSTAPPSPNNEPPPPDDEWAAFGQQSIDSDSPW